MNILITICARGGSKGIPGKNIKVINGKPLIFFSLNTAVKFSKSLKHNVDIVLSTDSDEITTVVRNFKLEINTSYKRPDFLASDSAGKIDAIKDVLNYSEQKNKIKYDFVLDLDVTSPLRTVNDLKVAFDSICSDSEAYNLFSVSPANRNPYFNMVEENNGYYNLCKVGNFKTRQSAPKVYDMNASFYIYRAMFFERGLKSAITDKSLVYEVPHLCFDLDHPIDFEFMSYLMTNDKLDFEL